MDRPIYPRINTYETTTSVDYETYLRKEYNGEMYLLKIKRGFFKFPSKEDTFKFHTVNQFHAAVYSYIIASAEMKNHQFSTIDGEPVLSKDENQTSEIKRVSDSWEIGKEIF